MEGLGGQKRLVKTLFWTLEWTLEMDSRSPQLKLVWLWLFQGRLKL